MKSCLNDLEWLLEYELKLAARHQRDVSLVLIADSADRLTQRLLESTIRKSDEIFSTQRLHRNHHGRN